MTKNSEIYRDLQEHLDHLPVGFPSTESGVEIRLLARLFDLKEAKVALHMKYEFEPVEDIFERIPKSLMTLETLRASLNNMAKKGAIMTSQKENKSLYSLAMWVIGMYEFQVNNLTEDFLKDVSQYSTEAFNKELVKSASSLSQFRVIPVNKSVSYKSEVATYNQLRKVIENLNGPIAVTNCICRQRRDLEGNPCEKSDLREVCMPLGPFAQHYIDQNIGRAISKEEAIKLVQIAEEKGFIVQSGNSQEPGFFCLCCGDCCGYLTGMKQLPRPVNYFNTYYFAEVDEELCSACETCIDRCQMNAISIFEDVLNVDRDRCLGCGLCVSTCPEEAIQLHKKEEVYIPPSDWKTLYNQISAKKHKI
ncbi:MAG: ATP-binding protein [Candidatus Hodarchaeales archaeon]|jgi:Na+-translocating ferredoxin:NAD+ oxidoreductase RNF subunit RnfB